MNEPSKEGIQRVARSKVAWSPAPHGPGFSPSMAAQPDPGSHLLQAE